METNNLPDKQYSQNLVSGYTYETFFEKYYQNAEKTENRLKSIIDENELLMVPSKKRFEGKVYVFIEKTFSAGSSFALFSKNQGITLVGEEIGGSYCTQTGGYLIIYILPNLKKLALISFVKISRYTKDETVKKGIGIMLDIEIPITVKDFFKKKDSQLDYVIKQITRNNFYPTYCFISNSV